MKKNHKSNLTKSTEDSHTILSDFLSILDRLVGIRLPYKDFSLDSQSRIIDFVRWKHWCERHTPPNNIKGSDKNAYYELSIKAQSKGVDFKLAMLLYQLGIINAQVLKEFTQVGWDRALKRISKVGLK